MELNCPKLTHEDLWEDLPPSGYRIERPLKLLLFIEIKLFWIWCDIIKPYEWAEFAFNTVVYRRKDELNTLKRTHEEMLYENGSNALVTKKAFEKFNEGKEDFQDILEHKDSMIQQVNEHWYDKILIEKDRLKYLASLNKELLLAIENELRYIYPEKFTRIKLTQRLCEEMIKYLALKIARQQPKSFIFSSEYRNELQLSTLDKKQVPRKQTLPRNKNSNELLSQKYVLQKPKQREEGHLM